MISGAVLLVVPTAADELENGIKAYKAGDYEEARAKFLLVVQEVESNKDLTQYRDRAYEFLGAACWKSSEQMRQAYKMPDLQFVRRGEAFASLCRVLDIGTDPKSDFIIKAKQYLMELCPVYAEELQRCGAKGGWEASTGQVRPVVSTTQWLDKSGRPVFANDDVRFWSVGETGASGLSQPELYQAAYEVFKQYADLGGPVGLMKVRFEPNVPGAEISLNGVSQPGLNAPCDVAVLLDVNQPEVTVAAQKGKYSPLEEKVVLVVGKQQDVVLRLSLPQARLTVSGSPAELEVVLDGKSYRLDEEIGIDIGGEAPRTYKLEAKAEGYEAQYLEVELEPGQTKNVPVELKPLPAVVVVTSDAAPTDAVVTIGGKGPYRLGEKITIAMEQPKRSVEVQVKAEGYLQTGPCQATLERGRETSVNVDLVKTTGWKMGFPVLVPTHVELGGKRIDIAVGADAVPWSDVAKTGDLVQLFWSKYGVMYYSGRLEGEGEQRRVVAGEGEGPTGGNVTLDNAVEGTSARLEPLPDKVPYMDRAGLTGRTDGDLIQWHVPVGQYQLLVDGFAPMDVTVPRKEPLSLAKLEPQEVDFRLSFEPPIKPDEIGSCTIEPKENGVPYLALHPEQKLNVDLKAAGWHHTLPAGTYELRVSWNGDRPLQCTQTVEVAVDSPALTLTKDYFTEVLVTVEVAGEVCYIIRDYDAEGRGAPLPIAVDLGKTAVAVTLIGVSGISRVLETTKLTAGGMASTRLLGSVPPGQYQIELRTKTLNRNGKEGPEVVCATAPGAPLTIKIPPPGRTKLMVEISGDVSAGEESRRNITITSLRWQ